LLLLEAKKTFTDGSHSARFDDARAFAVFCIITTGITYTFFLRGPRVEDTLKDSIPWISNILHHYVPIIITLDWLVFPSSRRVSWLALPIWIASTGIYAIVVELLGLATGTYPYFFLDPIELHGYTRVSHAALAFVPFFIVFGAFVIVTNHICLKIHNRLVRKTAPIINEGRV
jgi:hypothetical protein